MSPLLGITARMVKSSSSVQDVPPNPWRTYNMILSFGCIVISFMFGIANVKYAFVGQDGELLKLCQNEPNLCTLQTSVNYLMWIPFSASILLFLACWFNSTRLIHCCIGLIITDMVTSFIIM